MSTSRIPCFFLEPTEQVARKLRRYASIPKGGVPCPLMPGVYSRHDASVPIDPSTRTAETSSHDPRYIKCAGNSEDFLADPRWPKACGCGYVFTEQDDMQVCQDTLYRRADTGEIMTLRDAPPGALWYADWMIGGPASPFIGPDGHCLYCKTPGGDWCVDGPCTNCDKRGTPHKCWCRHGDPKTGLVTVDKQGVTCGAGAGSIMAGTYHGFLCQGVLKEC